MRGIQFKIPNLYGSFLNMILRDICIELYTWRISEDEVYADKLNNLFSSETINGQEFKKTICHPSYYIVFANLQAYPNETCFKEINTYEDFIKSKCEIIVLISDCIFVDIYAKEETIIEKIRHNAETYGFKDIAYLTDENDRKKELKAI